MVLQELVEVGQVKITDCVLDDNNVVLKVTDLVQLEAMKTHISYIIDSSV